MLFKQEFNKQLQHRVEFKARWARVFAKVIDICFSLLFCVIAGKWGIPLTITYIVLSDALFEGQSLGKKIAGFKVIDLETGNYCTAIQSILRNFILTIPFAFFLGGFIGAIIGFIMVFLIWGFEAYLVLTLGSFKRFGDIIANTSIIANDPDCEANIKKIHYPTNWSQDLAAPVQ